MSYDYYSKLKPQQQQPYTVSRYQMYYKLLLDTMLRFFYFLLIISIILTFIIIFFTNSLHTSHIDNYTSSQSLINHRHKDDIYYYFTEISNQMAFISKSVSKMLELQEQSYKQKGKLYYKQKKELTTLEKMMYLNKYNTTGQYACWGNCTGLQPFLVNLWDKSVRLAPISVIYILYYDPISNSTNIIFTPVDKNQLTQQQIVFLLSNKTINSSPLLIKINDQLFMTQRFSYVTRFSSEYQVTMAIGCSKKEMERILVSDGELEKHYDYRVFDDVGWVEVSGMQPLQVFAYKGEVVSKSISYTTPTSNLTLITFTCQTTQIFSYFSFVKLTLLLPILIFTVLFSSIKTTISKALYLFFKNTQTLVTLYEYNIQEIFTGKQPKQTIILNETTTTDFYQQLSQLPTSQYQPILDRQKKRVFPKGFIFVDSLKAIVERYNDYAKSIFQQKNKQIINNKFFIHASVNDLSQAQSQKIKQCYEKARQLRMLKRFFKYAYLSLLLDSQQFDSMISLDSSPLPQQLITMMRELNRTVNGTQVRRAFKLSPNILKQTQQQLEMRIQINLLQKYLQMLKQLDVHNLFAKELKLQNQLENINQYIENVKHILNKHNKNIRTIGR